MKNDKVSRQQDTGQAVELLLFYLLSDFVHRQYILRRCVLAFSEFNSIFTVRESVHVILLG